MNHPDALAARLLGMADDELILAHRNSEWTGHAPILEEDIAISNIAQDELGHATVWYGLHAACVGADPATHGDRLVFQRPAERWRNVQLLELPRGDWAFTLLRQTLFDAHEAVLLEAATRSTHAPLAQAAAKIAREERYHLLHGEAWVKRLALGTAESARRTAAAFAELWPACAQLFVDAPGDAQLADDGVLPKPSQLGAAWLARVHPLLTHCGLPVKALPDAPARGAHTPHLDALLSDLQAVARLDPEAQW